MHGLIFSQRLKKTPMQISGDLFLTSSPLFSSPTPKFQHPKYPQTQFSVLTQKDRCALLGILLSAPWSRRCLQTQNNHRAYLICFPSLRGHNLCSSFLMSENCHRIYFVHLLNCLWWKDNFKIKVRV